MTKTTEMMIEIAFTTFVVALIIFPIPPSTIIGVALAAHPKTGRFMNKRVYRIVQGTLGGVKAVVIYPAVKISQGREMSALTRIKAGTHRL